MTILNLRKMYHAKLFQDVIRSSIDKFGDLYPNFSDIGNKGSIAIARQIALLLQYELSEEILSGQTKGGRFEEITKDFLEQALKLLTHLRPGQWKYATYEKISEFEQYHHLADIQRIIQSNDELAAALGADYIIKPDIIIARFPFKDSDFTINAPILDDSTAILTPLRQLNRITPKWWLHASISCKWTLRSDRAQNARAEALNLLRHRKGRAPHISVVTAEPLPTRINSIALGTGDLDCIYHFALPELITAVASLGNEDQSEALSILVDGQRLRDISDLPFDLLS